MSRIAVIDVETTGLSPFRADRIVEIAAVIMTPDGVIERTFETLVNPQRDVGPTHIHGLTMQELAHAPRFSEVVGPLIEELKDCLALGGHNVRFDISFLKSEFERLGLIFPEVPHLCSMRLSGGGSLDYHRGRLQLGSLGRAHSALSDALVSATLLSDCLLGGAFDELGNSPTTWPRVSFEAFSPVTRANCTKKEFDSPKLLARLTNRPAVQFGGARSDEASQDYKHLLLQALEDRVLDEYEADALVEFAEHWGLTSDQAIQVHREIIGDLAYEAWSDGQLTEDEERDLLRVASLLGMSQMELSQVYDQAIERIGNRKESEIAHTPGFNGLSVCFTGECECEVNGERVTRTRAYELAEAHGMSVRNGVTKKLDIMVLADPLSQSTKARKAREYGVRIIQARVFWRALGLEVS